MWKKSSASRWFGKVAIIEWLRWEDSKFNGTRGICYCMCWWTLSFTVSKKAVKRWEYGWAATYTTYKCKQSKPLLWVVKEEFFPWEKINSSKSLRGVNSCVNFYDRHWQRRVICQEKWCVASQSINSITLSINWSALKASTSTTDNNQLLILKLTN